MCAREGGGIMLQIMGRSQAAADADRKPDTEARGGLGGSSRERVVSRTSRHLSVQGCGHAIATSYRSDREKLYARGGRAPC